MTTSTKTNVEKSEQGMTVSGSLVFSTITAVLDKSNDIVGQHISSNKGEPFVIDCNEINRVDSAGIALLLDWQRQCKQNNSICHFVGLSAQSQSLIQAYHLQSLLAA